MSGKGCPGIAGQGKHLHTVLVLQALDNAAGGHMSCFGDSSEVPSKLAYNRATVDMQIPERKKMRGQESWKVGGSNPGVSKVFFIMKFSFKYMCPLELAHETRYSCINCVACLCGRCTQNSDEKRR